jgi:hypothetical protein
MSDFQSLENEIEHPGSDARIYPFHFVRFLYKKAIGLKKYNKK